MPSMWPAGPLTSNSKRLALPFQTLLTTEVPSYSTHCFEAVKGCTRRETWVFQVPKLKSKSCWPSRFFGDCSGLAAPASDATIRAEHRRHARKYLIENIIRLGCLASYRACDRPTAPLLVQTGLCTAG